MGSLPPFPAPPPGSGDVALEESLPLEQERTSRWPILAALLALLAVAGGAVILMSWVLSGPPDCGAGAFISDRFGYCARVPSGWDTAAASSDESADRFFQLATAGTILVTAVPVSEGQDVERFASYVRSLDAESGSTVGQVSETLVAGVDALTFDATAGLEDDATRSREVVFVRDGFAWRVQVADTSAGFDASTRALDELLAGWAFV